MKKAALAGDLVEKLLKGFGLDERLQQYRALIIWEDVVGPQIAARTRPIRIREGILEVNVQKISLENGDRPYSDSPLICEIK